MIVTPFLLAFVVAADAPVVSARVDPTAPVVDASPEAGAPLTTPAAASADAGSAVFGDFRLTLRFADHLFVDGDYYRAITEYRRFLFLTKGIGDDAPRAAMAIGEALLRGEQWDAAGRQFDGVATRTDDLALRRDALFGAARAYLEDGRPELAKPRFRLIANDEAADGALRGQSRWLLAWGHFDAGELDRARDLFQAVALAGGPHAASARGVVEAIDQSGTIDAKDPLVAALLSVVPGGGHFYLGQWATGVTALTWNALFVFAAVSAWLSGDWGLATVLTFAELGWYSGSMFGAIAGAYRHNRDAVRNWRDDVLARYGADRALPELHTVAGEPPGSIVRLRGTF